MEAMGWNLTPTCAFNLICVVAPYFIVSINWRLCSRKDSLAWVSIGHYHCQNGWFVLCDLDEIKMGVKHHEREIDEIHEES